MKKSVYTWRRVLALALILVMAVTYMPFLSEPSAYAEAEEEVSEKVVELPDAEQKANKEKAIAEVEKTLGIEEEPETEEEEPAEMKAVMDVDPEIFKENNALALNNKANANAFKLNSEEGKNGVITSITKPNSKGIVTIKGIDIINPQYVYSGLWIADEDPEYDPGVMFRRISSLSCTSLDEEIDMKKYSVGYHSIGVSVYDVATDEEIIYDYVTKVPTFIYKKASNSINWYQTGKKYISAYYGGSNSYSDIDEDVKVYMDYKKKGGKWSEKLYGPTSSGTKKITGLRPNTTYYVRMMYVKKFKYNGQSYQFLGRSKGKVSSAKKVMTAYKKPKLKKITIKGKNIVHKYKSQWGWRIRYIKSTGRIISRTPLYHTYRYYYAKYKVNVYFKKKQNIAGVQVWTRDGTTQRNGNRKKYTVSYSVSGKRKGKKLTVKVKCFRSKKYGGFSGWTKKKVKVR